MHGRIPNSHDGGRASFTARRLGRSRRAISYRERSIRRHNLYKREDNAAARSGTGRSRESAGMNVLVLGGTVFLGRHLVRALLARGHTVTTFNRGTHDVDRDLPVTRIYGDRTNATDLARIPPNGWDAVVDPTSDVPDVVEASAR